MGKPKAPAPPDPAQTAGAQTAQNVSTAVAQQFLNNTNQNTPYGNLTYDQTGSYSMTDPNTGNVYEIPQFTATQNLSEPQQAILNQNQAADLNLATLANDQSAFLNEYMAAPFSYDPTEHTEWAGGLYDNLNSERNSREMESLNNRLAQQGIMPGSEAYDRMASNMYEGQSNARDRFMLDSYNTGLNTAKIERDQPINEISALQSGSQITSPNFVNTNPAQLANVDRAGLEMNAYNQELAAWQQQQQSRQSLMGGLFGLGSSFITAFPMK